MIATPSKSEAAVCDQLAKTLGYKVIRLEQRRASKIHIGTPDRRFIGKRAVFFEYKFGRDRLSAEQYTFLKAELDAGALASCGGLGELRDLFAAISRSDAAARNCCLQQIERMAAKGMRGTRNTPQEAA